jgi:hypothetical protein
MSAVMYTTWIVGYIGYKVYLNKKYNQKELHIPLTSFLNKDTYQK